MLAPASDVAAATGVRSATRDESGNVKVAAPLGGDDLVTRWQPVDHREGQVYQWPDLLEHYNRYDVYRGETRREGTVFIALGWTVRPGAWGMDRTYVVSFLSQHAPQAPLMEFLAVDDYAETGELVAVIRGSDGGRKMYGPARNYHLPMHLSASPLTVTVCGPGDHGTSWLSSLPRLIPMPS